MGVAAYNRGSRAIARSIRKDYGHDDPEDRPKPKPKPRSKDWGSKTRQRAEKALDFIRRSAKRRGRTLKDDYGKNANDLALDIQEWAKGGKVSKKVALEVAKEALAEGREPMRALFTDDTRDVLEENAEARWKRTLQQYEKTVRAYFVRENVKPTKTALRKLRKNPDNVARKLGLDHIGAFQSAIDKMIDDTMTLKDWKRELAKLQGQQHRAHSAAMREVPGGQAMGRKTSRDRGLASRHSKMRSIEKKIASMEGEEGPMKSLFNEEERGALQEAGSSYAAGFKTSGGGKPFGKIATYKIKGKAGIESGRTSYIVTVKTDRGKKDVVYVAYKNFGGDLDKAYAEAKRIAAAIDKGHWHGGRDDHPSRRIRSIGVKGKVISVEHDK